MRTAAIVGVVALALLVAVLGGCGGGGGTQSKGDAKVYPIGGVFENSGALENWGKASTNGMLLAVEELKGKDGIEFKPIIEDNKTSDQQAATAFIKLANVDKVIAVVGSVASSNTRAMKEQANKFKLPLLTHASTNVQLTKDTDWLYRVCWNDEFQGFVCAKFASEHLKAKRAVIVTDSGQDYSRGLSKNFRDAFIAAGGTIVDELFYQSKDQIFTSQVERLKSLDVDCVFSSGYATEVAHLVKASREAGFDKPFLGGDGLDDPQFFGIAGPFAGSGVFLCNHGHVDDPDPKVQAFVKAYRAKFKDAPINAMAFLAYDAVYALHDAVKRASAKGEVTRESLRDALGATKDLQLVTGTITIGPDREVRKRAVVCEMQANGEMKFVTAVMPEEMKK